MGTLHVTALVNAARRGCRRMLSALTALPHTIGWTGVVLAAVLVVAVALRLKGVGWGLPYSYQDPDERVVILHALRIARGHPNPQFFYYPSMFFDMVGVAVWIVGTLPEPARLAARLAGHVPDRPYAVLPDRPRPRRRLRGRLGVSDLPPRPRGLLAPGRPAGGAVPGLEPLSVRYSHVAVTDVPATMFGLLALLLFVRAAHRGSARTLMAGALAAGLAAGTKYNLGMLLVPGAVACWYVYRADLAGRRLWRLPLRVLRRVAAPMLVAFVACTPYAVLDPRHFLGDFYRQNQIVAHGWLGFENVHNGYWYNLSVNLVGSLGVVLVVLGLAGLALALARRTRADLVLVSYAVAYYLYVSSWHELMDRYLLPIVPVLIVLAVRACAELAAVPVVRRRALRVAVVAAAAALLLGALVMPARASLNYSRSLSGTDVRTVAKVWLEERLPPNAVIAEEQYGPPLVARYDLRYFTKLRLTTPSYHIYKLRLPLPGKGDPKARLKYLIMHKVRYVVLSSDVDSRVLAARAIYPAQVAFYEELARHARLIATFGPRAGERGPEIRVYELPATLTLAALRRSP